MSLSPVYLDRLYIACTLWAYLHLAHYLLGGSGYRLRPPPLRPAHFSLALLLWVSLQSSGREQHVSYCSRHYLFLPLLTFQLIELLPLRAPWWLRWCFCHLGSRRRR